jgi:hypothetical protein
VDHDGVGARGLKHLHEFEQPGAILFGANFEDQRPGRRRPHGLGHVPGPAEIATQRPSGPLLENLRRGTAEVEIPGLRPPGLAGGDGRGDLVGLGGKYLQTQRAILLRRGEKARSPGDFMAQRAGAEHFRIEQSDPAQFAEQLAQRGVRETGHRREDQRRENPQGPDLEGSGTKRLREGGGNRHRVYFRSFR